MLCYSTVCAQARLRARGPDARGDRAARGRALLLLPHPGAGEDTFNDENDDVVDVDDDDGGDDDGDDDDDDGSSSSSSSSSGGSSSDSNIMEKHDEPQCSDSAWKRTGRQYVTILYYTVT